MLHIVSFIFSVILDTYLFYDTVLDAVHWSFFYLHKLHFDENKSYAIFLFHISVPQTTTYIIFEKVFDIFLLEILYTC